MAAATVPSPRAEDQRQRTAAKQKSAEAERPANQPQAKLPRPENQGKFLYVPPDIMERYLLSARKAVLPLNAKAPQGPQRVVLNTFIAKDGTVSRTDVVEGSPALVRSAMAAVSWRRYRPFLLQGKPAEVVTPVTISYAATR